MADLEDAVAASGKEAARRALLRAGRTLAAEHPGFPWVVRVNKPGSDWFESDVDALAGLRPAGVVLPKVESPADVAALRDRLGPAQAGLPIIAGVETARGVLAVEQVAAEPSVHSLYFGAEDLIADLGGVRSEEGTEVLYARSRVALVARSYGIGCIDQVVVRIDDDERFERDARMGRSLGYQGKMCLHPRQVPLARRVFQPSSEEVAAAHRLLDAYESEAATGGGVIRLEGEMVDEPMVRRARAVLAWAGTVAVERGAGTDG